MGIGPHNKHMKPEDMKPSEDMITILRVKNRDQSPKSYAFWDEREGMPSIIGIRLLYKSKQW